MKYLGTSLQRYQFKPLLLPVLTAEIAESILKAMEENRSYVEETINLGLSMSLLLIENSEVRIREDIVVSRDHLLKMLKDPRAVYLVDRYGVYKVEIRAYGHYYKLVAVAKNKAPTVEINGIHMHRVESTDPWSDSMAKVRLARVKKGHRVLDICTGMGYTAIASRMMGATYVLTIEKDENVLEIARANPWSRRLSDPQIEIMLKDATEAVKELETSSFHRIIHDPPRFSMAGELYSREFYQELYRVLKPNGVLYHYVGSPGARYRGLDVLGGVASRLRRVGFIVKPLRSQGAILAFKV